MKNFERLLKEVEIEHKNESVCKTPYQYSNKIDKKVQKVLSHIDKNHNHSWAIEMYDRNQDNMDSIALLYRGTKITYKEMFEKAYTYAKSLKEMGFNKGDEIPICITNTPEFIYLFIATSFIGATANVVGEWFNKDYLTDILNKSNSKTIFIDDISYNNIKDSINESCIENIVCFSLMDSFRQDKKGQKINPYERIDSKFHKIENHLNEIKANYNGKLFNKDEFEILGNNYTGQVIENVNLDDACTITYTSGTTNPGRPKGVIQSNRSYITLSRFKESDVSGMPTMKNMTVLGHIPTYTHMELSCAVSDTFYCRCTLALEPFYTKEFFPYSVIMHKPNFAPASTGFWGYLCKLLNFDKSWKNINMPYLMIPTVTGEACSPGEEKFFNLTARNHKFGTEKLPFPLAPITFSIGGGTGEASGIFVTLFKALQEKKLNYLIRKEKLGLTPYKCAEIEALDKNGNYCDINKPGLLVAISPCEMSGYTDKRLNNKAHVVDAKGRNWLSLGTYGYKDRTGRVHMKGRMGNDLLLSDGKQVPYYEIEDSILSDTKNIMSCSVVEVINKNLVCNIEFQPYKQSSETATINGIINRIDNQFNHEVKDKLFFRFRDNKESFPLDPSGKRSLSTLKNIGIDDKTISFAELKNYYEDENVKSLKKSRF